MNSPEATAKLGRIVRVQTTALALRLSPSRLGASGHSFKLTQNSWHAPRQPRLFTVKAPPPEMKSSVFGCQLGNQWAASDLMTQRRHPTITFSSAPGLQLERRVRHSCSLLQVTIVTTGAPGVTSNMTVPCSAPVPLSKLRCSCSSCRPQHKLVLV